MQPVANTKTDASGNFTFDNPNIGGQPMLISRRVQGREFFTSRCRRKGFDQCEVFEPTGDAKTIFCAIARGDLSAQWRVLIVGEEYGVKNDSKSAAKRSSSLTEILTRPCRTTRSSKQIAASGPSGMPVVQAPIEKEKTSMRFLCVPARRERSAAFV